MTRTERWEVEACICVGGGRSVSSTERFETKSHERDGVRNGQRKSGQNGEQEHCDKAAFRRSLMRSTIRKCVQEVCVQYRSKNQRDRAEHGRKLNIKSNPALTNGKTPKSLTFCCLLSLDHLSSCTWHLPVNQVLRNTSSRDGSAKRQHCEQQIPPSPPKRAWQTHRTIPYLDLWPSFPACV